MFLIAQLLERAKLSANIESDYRLAKILSVNQSALSNYRGGRSYPTDKILAQLCALSGDDVAVMAAQIQAARAQSDEGRTMWEAIAQRLRGGVSTAILSVLFSIGLIASPADSARAGEVQGAKTQPVKSLYIVFSDVFVTSSFLLVRLRRFFPLFRVSLGLLLA